MKNFPPKMKRDAGPWPPLNEGCVALCVVDLIAFYEMKNELESALPPDELRMASRFHARSDVMAFIIRRAILRIILGKYLQTHPTQIQFTKSCYGKPGVAPLHEDTDLNFSVSRSKDRALISFSRKSLVGVDVEFMNKDFPILEISQRFFTKREFEFLLHLPAKHLNRAFYGLWVRKEAYLKAIGQGLSRPLDSFEIPIFPNGRQYEVTDRCPESCILDDIGAEWYISETDAGSQYAAAIAVAPPPRELFEHDITAREIHGSLIY
jgi:4'-phosphopantetheinyl transferase